MTEGTKKFYFLPPEYKHPDGKPKESPTFATDADC